MKILNPSGREFVEIKLTTKSSFEILEHFSIKDSIVSIKISGSEKEYTGVDLQKLKKIIEGKKPHWYEIVNDKNFEDLPTISVPTLF